MGKIHRVLRVGFKIFILVGLGGSLIALGGCAAFRSKHPPREKAMRLAPAPATIADDLPLDGLLTGIRQNIEQLERKTELTTLQFGPKEVAKSDYLRALHLLRDKLESGTSKEEFLTYLKENFEFYEIYGRKEWGEVFMTSYYDPVIEGAKTRTEKFSRPLYGLPPDMVTIRFDRFIETFPGLTPESKPHEQKSTGAVLRGRLVRSAQGVPEVVPFYSREEIDGPKAPLDESAAILAWVDPIQSFFLQIQGSGKIRFVEDGSEIRVGYAAQNGHPYVAIGRYMLDVIPREEMSLQTIERHLRSVSPEERDRILNLNPSYVFFQRLDSKSLTYFGSEVIAGRTIATDRRYFPKGALAYLAFEKPVFADDLPGSAPVEWQPTSRLVIDQDTGGAIRGPDRLDLYWGEGDKALQTAGIMKNWGRIYYLVPGVRLLDEISAVDRVLP